MTIELDRENPPGVLSEVETCRCAPLNQCKIKFCSDGISMIIATILFRYLVDYNKQVQMIIYYLKFVLCVFIILLILFRYISFSVL